MEKPQKYLQPFSSGSCCVEGGHEKIVTFDHYLALRRRQYKIWP